MFKHFKNIETAFRHVRLFSFVVIGASTAICGYTLLESYRMVTAAQQRIYILSNGKAMEALAADRRDNVPVEARDHIKTFHQYFFSLDPDEKIIARNIGQALYLADGTAKQQYDDLTESGYYAGIISGNVSQQLETDSITVDLGSYPYYFRFYGKQKMIRPTVTVSRSLLTDGYLRNVGRSDNNPHGFLIERWRILENKDLDIQKR
ncbi:conjugative transposon protein TraK [Pedobacter sp. KR3-3]|uniref:Conjugative transposon protein TraK n=1 Tax=Pedobacter albus TaxID=3113905 RepID=A0ABU7IAL7_9SPHI|nr:conjugative transposon protein TraK [Pedobacter sp. KR3-3]MEE1946401.1 conjugative transposon protein TraK [Pedobacter sp. KR3-3]